MCHMYCTGNKDEEFVCVYVCVCVLVCGVCGCVFVLICN